MENKGKRGALTFTEVAQRTRTRVWSCAGGDFDILEKAFTENGVSIEESRTNRWS